MIYEIKFARATEQDVLADDFVTLTIDSGVKFSACLELAFKELCLPVPETIRLIDNVRRPNAAKQIMDWPAENPLLSQILHRRGKKWLLKISDLLHLHVWQVDHFESKNASAYPNIEALSGAFFDEEILSYPSIKTEHYDHEKEAKLQAGGKSEKALTAYKTWIADTLSLPVHCWIQRRAGLFEVLRTEVELLEIFRLPKSMGFGLGGLCKAEGSTQKVRLRDIEFDDDFIFKALIENYSSWEEKLN